MLVLSLVVLALLPAAAAANEPYLGTSVDVVLSPSVGLLHRHASIEVTGIDVPSLQVRLVGATNVIGQPFSWRPLVFAHGAWRGALPTPDLRGIYPVELRVGAGTAVLRSARWLFHVFARGTLARPSFPAPQGVARWWVRTLPGHATLVAVKFWPRPADDRRDVRLHRLLVLAYTLRGHEKVRERLGIFVTAVRDGYGGRWRMLEAKAVP